MSEETAARWRRRARMTRKVLESQLALLKRLEWSGVGQPYDTGGREPVCPVCYQSRWTNTHLNDCEIALVISTLSEALGLDE